MKRNQRLLLGLLCLAPLMACAAEEAVPEAIDSVTTTAQPLYVASTKIWTTSTVAVCWENPDANGSDETERSWVKDSVATTWSLYSNVQLTGWGKCQSGAKGIRIKISDETPHTDALGKDLDGKANGMVLNFTFTTWSKSCQTTREACIRAIAPHEFGHALGFSHEQNRPDTQTPPCTFCDATHPCGANETCKANICRQGEDGDTTFGDWDFYSIMDYCSTIWNNDGRLSSTDVAGAQFYYGSNARYLAAWNSLNSW